MPTLKYCLITRPRTGSQFLFNLVKAAVGDDNVYPTSSLTPGRREKALDLPELAFKEFCKTHPPAEYFEAHGVKSLKIEEPEVDDLAYQLAEAYPDSKFLTSFRPFELVAQSHHKISWGNSPETLVEKYDRHLGFMSEFIKTKPVFFVDVNDKNRFDLARFCNFMDISPDDFAQPQFIDNWPVINNAAYRVQHDGAKDTSDGLAESATAIEAGSALDKQATKLLV